MLYICAVNLLQTYIKVMNIPNKKLLFWKSLKEEGDIKELADLIGKAQSTVHQIIREGVAKVADVELIDAFYKKRQKKIAAIHAEHEID